MNEKFFKKCAIRNYFIFVILNYFYKGGPYSLPTPVIGNGGSITPKVGNEEKKVRNHCISLNGNYMYFDTKIEFLTD